MALKLTDSARARLTQEKVAWLTTVRGDGLPQPAPIWFLWDGKRLSIYSKPDALKIRNIAAHPRVAVHLNSDEWGNRVLVLWGTATVEPPAAHPAADPAYVDKYRQGIADLGETPESLAAAYSAVIRVTPERVREE